MRLILFGCLAMVSIVSADVLKDQKYLIVDRYCPNGSDALQQAPKGTTIVFTSEGEYVVEHKDAKVISKYTIEQNILTNILPSQTNEEEVTAKSVLRTIDNDIVLMISSLPEDKEKAKAVCAKGSHVTTVLRLQKGD